jgi:hypothetical protein
MSPISSSDKTLKMTQIKITEFAGYDKPSFLAFLNICKNEFIDLVLPKEYDKNHGQLFLLDYYKLLYVLQILQPHSEKLIHNWPNPSEKGAFSIIILYKPSALLYDTLWYIRQGFDKNNVEQYEAFESRAIKINTYIKEGIEIESPLAFQFIMDQIMNK